MEIAQTVTSQLLFEEIQMNVIINICCILLGRFDFKTLCGYVCMCKE